MLAVFLVLMIFGLCVVLPVCLVEDCWNGSLWNKRRRYRRGKVYSNTAVQVTFRQFKSYRDINPEAYSDMDDNDPKKTMGRIGYDRTFISGYGCYGYNHILVFKSFSDYLQYVQFLKEEEHKSERKKSENDRKKSMENAAEYYQAVLKDIEKVRKQAQDEAEQAKRYHWLGCPRNLDGMPQSLQHTGFLNPTETMVYKGTDKNGTPTYEVVRQE